MFICILLVEKETKSCEMAHAPISHKIFLVITCKTYMLIRY